MAGLLTGGPNGAKRLPVLLLSVTAGCWIIAGSLGVDGVHTTPAYHLFALSLLAIGLYGSTRGIDRAELRKNLRVVLVAVTVGVVGKTALIAAVMYLIDSRPISLVLGVAVAQIDPLSVTATLSRRMSESAKALLSAWAAFDDPVTVLLVVYLSAFALGADGAAGGGLSDFGMALLLNAGFAAAALCLTLSAKLIPRPSTTAASAVLGAVAAVVVGGFAVLAVTEGLMLGVALSGLFFRPFPRLDDMVGEVFAFALLLGGGALGLVLAGVVGPGSAGLLLKGVALGVAAFGAQMLIGWLIALQRPRYDRWCLALSQQNGLTAVVLALLLEADFPGTVAVVAPAIVVTNVLFALGRRWLDTVPDDPPAAVPATGREKQAAPGKDVPGFTTASR